jgi:hypothetical protein
METAGCDGIAWCWLTRRSPQPVQITANVAKNSRKRADGFWIIMIDNSPKREPDDRFERLNGERRRSDCRPAIAEVIAHPVSRESFCLYSLRQV